LARRRVGAGGQAQLTFVVDEIALALTCTRQAAWVTVHTALDLVERLPETLAALGGGRICGPGADHRRGRPRLERR